MDAKRTEFLFKAYKQQLDLGSFSGSHEIFTPFKLVNEMIEQIPDLHTKESFFVMYNVEFAISLVYNYDIPPSRIHIYVDHLAKDCLVHKMRLNVVKSLEDITMKFDVILGNPPYQDGNREDAANKLWPLFIKRSSELLNSNGYSALVTPNGWMQPTADIGKGTGKNAISIFNDIFKPNNLIMANVDSTFLQRTYFNGVGSTFSYFVFQKAQYIAPTKFVTESGVVLVDISKIDALPKILSNHGISICEKMVGDSFIFCDQNHNLNGNESPVMDKEHPYMIYHTNKKGGTFWYGATKCIYTDVPKVIISLSGKYLPIVNTTNGFSNMCLALICNTLEEANNAQMVLSSKLYQFWVEMSKFSGFNPRKLILTLPKVDITKSWTDEELYQHFGLTQDEIDYIEATVK